MMMVLMETWQAKERMIGTESYSMTISKIGIEAGNVTLPPDSLIVSSCEVWLKEDGALVPY